MDKMIQTSPLAPLTVIGLMSGTSADGIDACIISTDGIGATRTGIRGSFSYRPDIQRAIVAARSDPSSWLAEPNRREALITAITEDHAAAVLALAAKTDMPIDLIGFHGQTVYHNPTARRTIQLGNGMMLAQITGIDTVYDFRQADMEAGGEGAPLAPIYHQMLATDAGLFLPVLFLNLGGVANVSLIEQGRLTGCDIGPANGLIDEYCQTRLGVSFDMDGARAATGIIDHSFVEQALQHPFFMTVGPRSLDRATFADLLDDPRIANAPAEDALASLTEVTARAVQLYIELSGTALTQLILSGGGTKNSYLRHRIKAYLPAEITCITADEAGFDSAMMEAELIAYLAARKCAQLPSTFPQTTRASSPQICGVIAKAPRV